MSLSFDPGYYPGQTFDDALEYAYKNNVTIVTATTVLTSLYSDNNPVEDATVSED